MMSAKTIGPLIWGARSGGDGTTFNWRDRQAHDRTVQAARCQPLSDTSGPSVTLSMGPCSPSIAAVIQACKRIAEGRRRAGKDLTFYFSLGPALGVWQY